MIMSTIIVPWGARGIVIQLCIYPGPLLRVKDPNQLLLEGALLSELLSLGTKFPFFSGNSYSPSRVSGSGFYSLSIPCIQCFPGLQVYFPCPEGRRPLYVCTSYVQTQRGNARSGLDTFLSFERVICPSCIGTALKACLLFGYANLSLQRKLLFPFLCADVIPSITRETQVKIKENKISVQFRLPGRKA